MAKTNDLFNMYEEVQNDVKIINDDISNTFNYILYNIVNFSIERAERELKKVQENISKSINKIISIKETSYSNDINLDLDNMLSELKVQSEHIVQILSV